MTEIVLKQVFLKNHFYFIFCYGRFTDVLESATGVK